MISLLRHNQTVQREEDGAIGKLVWPQEEVQKDDISIALMIPKEFFTSVLFRDTLDVVSLIVRYRTMQ